MTVLSRSSLILLLVLPATQSAFVYTGFNQTHGLAFVGDAAITSCVSVYEQGYAKISDNNYSRSATTISETEYSVTHRVVETNWPEQQDDISSTKASFGHRDDAQPSPDVGNIRCPTRARLTGSRPSKAGALWYEVPLPVLKGFETLFTFQITDHSRWCSQHVDPSFSTNQHTSCAVAGGDGLAFVIHRDPRGIDAVGLDGGEMGYGGLYNSLAIEFDTWTNQGHHSTSGNKTGAVYSEMLHDHVAVHSMGAVANNTALDSAAELAPPRPWSLGDGHEHLVRVQYFPYLATRYLANFTARPQLLEYMRDNGESRRMGTVVVWIDGGVTDDTPIVAIPINLSVLLDLPDDQAYVGFTSASGNAWAKHDLLSWYWCHEDECGDVPELQQFDYHQTSAYSATARYTNNPPGEGYGGGDAAEFPTEHQNPDTTAWGPGKEHFSLERTSGIFSTSQVPPSTENRR